MNTLEYFYENPPNFSNFHARKYEITSKKTIIHGSKKSGKTFIILDFLSGLKSKDYLYLNIEDMRIKPKDLFNINDFIHYKNIKTLVIENYNPTLPLPKLDNIILTTSSLSLSIDGYEILKIFPLDFEEFIGFSAKNFDTNHLFTLFTHQGRLPSSYNFNINQINNFHQEYLRLCFPETLSLKVFFQIAINQGKVLSAYKLFLNLKDEMKISKDKAYKVWDEILDMSFFYQITKFDSPKANKKIFLDNFALKDSISIKKDFMGLFSNIVFCELQKLRKEIFYLDEFDFYLLALNQGILCSAFTPPELIMRKIKKMLPRLKELNINNFYILSLNHSHKTNLEGIEIEILPFTQWALTL